MTILGTMTSNVSVKLGDSTVGQYFSEALIKKSIGDAYRIYVMKMIELGDGYFETTTNLNLVANTAAISLAGLTPEYIGLSQLERYVSEGTIPLIKDERRYKSNVNTGVGSGDAYLPTFKFRGTNLILEPTPASSETDALKLDYIYVPTFPNSTSANAFEFDANFPTIFETNVEIRAAIKCQESKDAIGGVSDIATFRQELIELDDAFYKAIQREEQPEAIEYVGVDYSTL